MAGVTGAVAPSGQLNPGNVSISGQRESANSFLVNGSDVQERMNGGTSIVPEPRLGRSVPRAHEQLRSASTATTTAASSTSSPSRAATRSTAAPSISSATRRSTPRNYFSPERADVQAEPARRHGRRSAQEGQDVLLRRLSGDADDAGHRDRAHPGAVAGRTRRATSRDVADSLTGTVNGPYWANLLSQRLGYAVTPGEPYYTPGCTSSAQCVFPNASHSDARVVARRRSTCCSTSRRRTRRRGTFSTGAFAQTVRDDKGSVRVDGNTPARVCCPATTSSTTTRSTIRIRAQQGGANVPGFDALTIGRAQLCRRSAATRCSARTP